MSYFPQVFTFNLCLKKAHYKHTKHAITSDFTFKPWVYKNSRNSWDFYATTWKPTVFPRGWLEDKKYDIELQQDHFIDNINLILMWWTIQTQLFSCVSTRVFFRSSQKVFRPSPPPPPFTAINNDQCLNIFFCYFFSQGRYSIGEDVSVLRGLKF